MICSRPRARFLRLRYASCSRIVRARPDRLPESVRHARLCCAPRDGRSRPPGALEAGPGRELVRVFLGRVVISTLIRLLSEECCG